MRKLFIALALPVLLVGSSLALAQASQPETPLMRQADAWAPGLSAPLLLDDVACNEAAANRTWTSTSTRGQGFGVIMFQFNLTQTAATSIAFLPEVSLDGQTTWASVPPCDDTTDGTCALTATGQFTRAVSASENIALRVDFMGAPDVRLTITCTGGGANDVFDLLGRYSVQ